MHRLSNPTRYTVTAALPYANGPIHIGHLAGVYVPADIYVRYLRSKKADVLFLSGSDEHGVPITIRAQQTAKSPQQIVDQYHALNKQDLESFGISFNIFARTSSPLHHQTAADFFTTLYQKGILTTQETEQYYDPVAHQFLADRYVRGTCPSCKYSQAYGDQCEKCGTTLSPEELINPYSVLSGEKPIAKTTKHWYLPLQDYEAWLKHWILEIHTDWKPNVYGQCKAWLDHGLQPRAITRDLDWGVPVPLPEGRDKVLYVWFDAPIGYISAAKEWARDHQRDWEPFWKDSRTKLVHFLGKDNIVFHALIFPTMLKAHGEFILPDQVVANEFMNLGGEKISTSRDHAVWLHDYLDIFKDKQDVLRYVLTTNAPESKDGDFTWQDFQTKNNNELVATLGNFVNRTLVLIHKCWNGVMPPCQTLIPVDQVVIRLMQQAPSSIGTLIERFRFKEALHEWMELARMGNRYLSDTAPWHLIKEQPERAQTVLNISVQLVAHMAILGAPFLPFTCRRMAQMLTLSTLDWADADKVDLIQPGTKLQPPQLLFERMDGSIFPYEDSKS
jgi:methionyl-tRNA synthetase